MNKKVIDTYSCFHLITNLKAKNIQNIVSRGHFVSFVKLIRILGSNIYFPFKLLITCD